MSSAWRLVSDAEKRQPTLPVQAMSPVRIRILVASPSHKASAATTFSSGTPDVPEGFARYRKPEIAVALRDPARPRICVAASRATGRTTPIQLKPGCFLGVHTDTAIPSNSGRSRMSMFLEAPWSVFDQAFLRQARCIFPRPQASSTYLQLRRGATPVRDVHTHNGVGDLRCFFRGLTITPGRKPSWPVMPPSARLKPHARLGSEAAGLHLDGLKPDVVGNPLKDGWARRPAPSNPTLNLRGKPYSARSLRIWKCHSRA